jgi:hypothetical protein
MLNRSGQTGESGNVGQQRTFWREDECAKS